MQFKRNEPLINDAANTINVAIDNSSSFICKSIILGKPATDNDNNRVLKNIKIVIPLKNFKNFWKLLEISLANFKVYLELN